LEEQPKEQKIILGDGVAFINKGGKGSTKTKTKRNKDHIACSNAMKQATVLMNAQMQKKADDEKQLLTNGNDDKDYEDYEDDLGD